MNISSNPISNVIYLTIDIHCNTCAFVLMLYNHQHVCLVVVSTKLQYRCTARGPTIHDTAAAQNVEYKTGS